MHKGIKNETYTTDLNEVQRALSLADKDKKMIIKANGKIIVICELNNKQQKALKISGK